MADSLPKASRVSMAPASEADGFAEPTTPTKPGDRSDLELGPRGDAGLARLFVGNAMQRFGSLERQAAGRLAAHLPEDFCRLYPSECAILRGATTELVGSLFARPSEAQLEALAEGGEVPLLLERGRDLSALWEAIQGYYSRESAASRGEQEPISIQDHLGQRDVAVIASLRQSSRAWALIDAYGRNLVQDFSSFGGSFSTERDELEASLHALLWEERCRAENRMLAHAPSEVAFWFHLSRVMTRHVYDDSYWIEPDELTAAQRNYPFHLER